MVITLGNIVFGGKGNGGSAPAAYVVPDGMNFGYSTLTEFPSEGLDFSQKTNFSKAWYNCIKLTEFPALNMGNGTNFAWAWGGCSSLTSIGQLDLHNGTNFGSAWMNCKALVNLGGFGAIKESIDLSPCTKLTVDSLMNVITQAATVTGKSMKFGSDNLAKLTDEQKAVATNKGWTLA